MKLLIGFLSLFFISQSLLLSAQYDDSLKKLIQATGTDSARLDYSIELIDYYLKNDINKADSLLTTLENTFTADNNKKGLAKVYNYRGNYYRFIFKNDEALKYYFKSLNLNEEIGNEKELLNNYGNVGQILFLIEEYELSMDYSWKAINLCRKINYDLGIGFGYYDIANSFFKMEKYDSAMVYSNLSKQIAEKNNFRNLKLLNLDNISEINLLHNEYDKVIELTNIIVDSCLKINDNFTVLYSYTRLGKAYLGKGDIKNSLEYFKKAEVLAEYYKLFDQMKEIYGGLSDINALNGNYKEAFKYLKNADNIEDSLFNIQKSVALKNVNKKYEQEKMQKEIEIAKKDESIKSNQRNILIFIVVLMVGIIIFVIYQYKEKSRYNFQLKEKNDEIEKTNSELQEINTAKDKFFSIVAHDLRNPIGSLKSISEYFSNSYSDFSEDEKIEFIGLMKDSSKNALVLLENLLQWARSQNGSIKFEPTMIDINSLVLSTIQVIKLSAESKKISIENKITNPIQIYADENMLTTVIRNLLSNAVKFTEEDGKVTIDAEQKDNKLIFVIKDTGTGISKENIEKLFKIDKYVSTLGTKMETGSGLGLILCKEFVEKHNGQIWAESEINFGSTFYFSIPINNNLAVKAEQN